MTSDRCCDSNNPNKTTFTIENAKTIADDSQLPFSILMSSYDVINTTLQDNLENPIMINAAFHN